MRCRTGARALELEANHAVRVPQRSNPWRVLAQRWVCAVFSAPKIDLVNAKNGEDK